MRINSKTSQKNRDTVGFWLGVGVFFGWGFVGGGGVVGVGGVSVCVLVFEFGGCGGVVGRSSSARSHTELRAGTRAEKGRILTSFS